MAVEGDEGWTWRFSRKHPELYVRYVGYLEHGYTFAFAIEGYPDLLKDASWATWDVLGNLWVARPGLVERYKLTDIKRGVSSFSLDVEQFELPPRANPVPTVAGSQK
jgi:hypothetical protein